MAEGGTNLTIDFRPDVEEGALAARLVRKPGQTVSTLMRKAGLSPVAAALMREAGPLPETAEGLARRAKACELRLVGTAPIARAISTAGGVAWSELDEDFMLARRPGVFVAGEMIDWEAPTGGYLLQACFSTGAAAGGAAARFAASADSSASGRSG
jgi:predicted flavoprotein YhiN